MAGVATEVCLAQSVFSALKEGYDVFFVSDCSSGVTQEAHDDAKSRMIMAGAKPVNWLAVISEWTPDINSPERAALSEALGRRAGTSSLWFEYVFAQIEGGIVPAPTAVAA